MADFNKPAPQHKPGEGDELEMAGVREFLAAYGPSLLVSGSSF